MESSMVDIIDIAPHFSYITLLEIIWGSQLIIQGSCPFQFTLKYC